jgi:hypothetical protein
MDTDFLDWALADFSGYVAADELYDGPFCILSTVDNRRYKRLLYDVLDHDPAHDDIRAFLGRLKTALVARGLTLCGVTTDGSALYPEPLLEVFGDVPHQICTFYIVAEVSKAVLGAVASARKRTQQPLSVKAIQKKMERYAKAAGITASCHSLRHTFASNLLEHGAEVVAIRDFLGHSQIASSERYAKISSQKIKQEYMRTMQKILKQGQV